MKDVRSIILLVFFVLSVLLIAINLWLVSFIVVIVRKKGETHHEDNEIYEYQYFTTLNDQYNFGSISIPQKIENEEGYISYRTEDGTYTLISEFGLDEFECYGSCFCEDQTFRRSSIASRGLTYVLAATSSLVAFNLAFNHFQDACVKKISDSCPSGSIRSEFEECFPLVMSDSSNEGESVGGSMTDDESDGNSRSGGSEVYYCEGHCVELKYDESTSRRTSPPPKVDDKYKCEEFKTSSEVVIEADEIIEAGGDIPYSENEVVEDSHFSYREPHAQQNQYTSRPPQEESSSSFGGFFSKAGQAVSKFKKDVLDPFCKEVGTKLAKKVGEVMTRKTEVKKRQDQFTQQQRYEDRNNNNKPPKRDGFYGRIDIFCWGNNPRDFIDKVKEVGKQVKNNIDNARCRRINKRGGGGKRRGRWLFRRDDDDK